jgi:hypothetical protein
MTTKCTIWTLNLAIGREIYQMAIKYTNIFRYKTLQNLPQKGFFGLKIYHLATLGPSSFAGLLLFKRLYRKDEVHFFADRMSTFLSQVSRKSRPGMPDFPQCMIPRLEKMYQTNTKCTKWSWNFTNGRICNIPNGHKIYQHFPISGPR